jgi:2-alkyl-3-oxoalkanoate reductase
MAEQRVAILGANGQVGRALMGALAERPGIHPVGICRRTEAAVELRKAGWEAHSFLLRDAHLSTLLSGCHALVNCVLARGTVRQVRKAEGVLLGVLRELPNGPRLIHLSSVSVYAPCYNSPELEWRSPNPYTFLGRNKLWVERNLRRQSEAAGRPCLLVRLGHVYGAGQYWSRRIALAHLDDRSRLALNGRCASNCIHIRSVADTLGRVILSGPDRGTYNLVQDPQWTWREVFDWHARAMALPPVPASDPGAAEDYLRTLRRRYALGRPSGMAFPSVKQVVRRGIRALGGDALEERALSLWQALRAGRADGGPTPPGICDEWLYGDPAPGPALGCEHAPGPSEPAEVLRWLESIGVLRAG